MSKIPIDIKEGKLKDVSELIIGIDLGTTNSLVSYVKDGEPVVIKTSEGDSALVPSIIHFDNDGKIIVGDEARKQLIKAPERTIFSAKRLMGKSYKDIKSNDKMYSYKIVETDEDQLVQVNIDDKYYTPIELSAEILKELKSRIEKTIDKEVDKAVITVPAYFNDTQRQATRDAGKLAGLDVLRVINEPTAASLAYGLNKNNEEAQTIAVYDLGGGTFDISILAIEDGVFEVLSTNGNTMLGGDDFDKAIFNYWVEAYDLKLNKEDHNDIQSLRLESENAKKSLSTSEEYKAELTLTNGKNIALEISRNTFNELIAPLVAQTIASCELALKDANLVIEDIDNVVMVGGSTRVLLVKEKVSLFFDNDLIDDIDPDEVVAIGAGIQADILAGNRKDMLLLDITPLSLGIETVGGLMDVIIPRNSKIPTKVGRKYTTSVDGQKNLKVAVFQGERDLVEDNRKLAEFVLKDIPPMAAGIPQIEIQFLIDADGILIVKAKELRSNTETKVQIKSQYGISEEDMARMLLDSIKNAESDMQKRSFLEVQNEVNNISLAAKKFVAQNQSWLVEDQVSTIITLEQKMIKSLDSRNVDQIRKTMDELNSYTEPLAHEALDRHIGNALKGEKL